MSCKLAYSTMFDPPPVVHQQFEAALVKIRGLLGQDYGHLIDGNDDANGFYCATTGASPGYQRFGGWKGSGNAGKEFASKYYLSHYRREQSRTIVG